MKKYLLILFLLNMFIPSVSFSSELYNSDGVETVVDNEIEEEFIMVFMISHSLTFLSLFLFLFVVEFINIISIIIIGDWKGTLEMKGFYSYIITHIEDISNNNFISIERRE